MRRLGFTLIELIVVMALLSSIVALAAPRLAKFVHGRSLNEEARRFLTVLQYARSEAISKGVPIQMQIYLDEGRYRLQPAAGYSLSDWPEREYNLNPMLAFEILPAEANRANDKTAVIHFLPDGYLDDISLRAIQLYESRNPEDALWVAQNEQGVRYKIFTQDEFDEEQILR